MSSDTRLFQVFIPNLNKIRIVRSSDFKSKTEKELPRISKIFDGLDRESKHDAQEGNTWIGNTSEEHILYAMTAQNRETYPNICDTDNWNHFANVPASFEEAQEFSEWRSAIDKEYRALISRCTWTYTKRSIDIWTFKSKYIDPTRKRYICKTRWVARGDRQLPNIDYDPDGLYAPVASHDSIRLLIAICAALKFELKTFGVQSSTNSWCHMDSPTEH